jgi:hypothetical protein
MDGSPVPAKRQGIEVITKLNAAHQAGPPATVTAPLAFMPNRAPWSVALGTDLWCPSAHQQYGQFQQYGRFGNKFRDNTK